MMKATDYKSKNPQRVLAKFFDCCKRRAWKQILKHVQSSWLARHKEPSKELRMAFRGIYDVEDMGIIFHKKRTSHTLSVNIKRSIEGKSHTSIVQSHREAKLTYEEGKWRVDPESIR